MHCPLRTLPSRFGQKIASDKTTIVLAHHDRLTPVSCAESDVRAHQDVARDRRSAVWMPATEASRSIRIEEFAMATRDRLISWLVPPIMVPIILALMFWAVAATQR